jgi:zinc protease
MMGFYRLPLDWLGRYVARVNAVTPERVQDAFARRIDPERLALIQVGGDGAVGSK